MPNCCQDFSRGCASSDSYGGCFGECCTACPPCCGDGVRFVFNCGNHYSEACSCPCIDFTGIFCRCLSPVSFHAQSYNIIKDETLQLQNIDSFEDILEDFESFEELDEPINYDISHPYPIQEMPIFSKEDTIISDDGNFVFALEDGCSVPCAVIEVDITVNPDADDALCCIEVDCEADTAYAIGDGVVECEFGGEKLVPGCVEDSCEPIALLNGQACGGAYEASDGEILDVTLTSSDPCCVCCYTHKIDLDLGGGPGIPHCPGESMAITTDSIWYTKGNKKILKTRNLLNKINYYRKAKVYQKIKKLSSGRKR